jgi:hypothetical protein
MATTTNYSWTTPDDTALVKDGAAAIRSLGTAIDTTVFNNAGAAIAKTIVDAKGDIIAATGADTVARLASSGVNGEVLTVDTSTATGLKYAMPAGGKVLQVVQGSTTTPVTSATTSEVDTGITATITPSSATSKILILTSVNGCYKTNGNATNGLRLRLYRGATDIARIATNLLYTATALNLYGSTGLSYLDNPATTSATTYKITFHNLIAANSANVQADNETSTIVLLEIGA